MDLPRYKSLAWSVTVRPVTTPRPALARLDPAQSRRGALTVEISRRGSRRVFWACSQPPTSFGVNQKVYPDTIK